MHPVLILLYEKQDAETASTFYELFNEPPTYEIKIQSYTFLFQLELLYIHNYWFILSLNNQRVFDKYVFLSKNKSPQWYQLDPPPTDNVTWPRW